MWGINFGFITRLFALLVLMSCGPHSKETPQILTSTSPGGEYTVRLKEAFHDRGYREARFDLLRSDKILLEDEPLWSGREWDGPFISGHPNIKWVSDSAIMFGQNSTIKQTQNDVIELVNNSNKSFRYLGINTARQNMYLLFDFHQGAIVTLSTEPQTDKDADFSEISYWGKTSEGSKLHQGVADFAIKDQYRNPAHYQIIITDKGVTITSIEGFSRLEKK